MSRMSRFARATQGSFNTLTQEPIVSCESNHLARVDSLTLSRDVNVSVFMQQKGEL
jgi:hypothetical protein